MAAKDKTQEEQITELKNKSDMFEKLKASRDLSDFIVRETAKDIFSECYDIMKTENKKLRDALEFYAYSADLFEGYDELDDYSAEESLSSYTSVEVLGKRARQALKDDK